MNLTILTKRVSKLKRDDIRELYVPTELGEVGILEAHTHYITKITQGELRYFDYSNKKETLEIEPGFLHVKNDEIVILETV
jgi:F0F1-type ATP synthase epsilon subunit